MECALSVSKTLRMFAYPKTSRISHVPQIDSLDIVRPLPECVSHGYVYMASAAIECNEPRAQEGRH